MSTTNYDTIVCRYGELTTKGKNRKDFINKLIHNTKTQLSGFSDLRYRYTHDRFFIALNGTDAQAVSAKLCHVFGISSFSLACQCEPDLEVMIATAVVLVQEAEGKTFKVIARRHDKTFEPVSDTINRHVAAAVLGATDLKVDVHNPDIKIYIEVRKDSAYIMAGRIEGAKGYPVGIQGKVMMMLSGGIDSPVAAYLMMKRGVKIECVHFASPPYTSVEAQNKVIALAQKLTAYQAEIKVHIVPFTDIQLAIYKHGPESYAITMMRRFMLYIGEELAKKRSCLAVANGESLGQVASQTLHSIKAITSVSTLPILRPLITYDKIEIINLAQTIDTYDTSILPFDDCCTIFTPKNPTTRPHGDKIQAFEDKLDLGELIVSAIARIETITVAHDTHEADSFL